MGDFNIENPWVPTDACQLAWGGEPILDPESSPEPDLETDNAYDEAFERVAHSMFEIEAEVARERSEVPRLVDSLLAQPAGRRELLIRNSRKFQTPALSQALIRASHDLGRKDPQRSLEVGALATAVADRLDTAHYGTCLVNDLRASAWGQHANALRVVSDLRKSEHAFGIAEHCLAQGTGDPLERARLQELRAQLRRDQRQFPESIRLMREAIDLYGEMADYRMEGRALATLGIQHALAGNLEEAIRCTHRAISKLDPTTDSRLVCQAQYNLLNMTFLNGDTAAAAEGIAEARRQIARFGDDTSLLRLRWLEGQIEQSLGHFERAARAFLEAKEGFIEKGVAYNAALVSLELAGLYAGEGRTAEVKALVAEMLPIFQSRDIHREALAALVLYRDAVQAETATVALAEEVRTFLEASRGNPKLRFRNS